MMNERSFIVNRLPIMQDACQRFASGNQGREAWPKPKQRAS
jgi:hypothetical protein